MPRYYYSLSVWPVTVLFFLRDEYQERVVLSLVAVTFVRLEQGEEARTYPETPFLLRLHFEQRALGCGDGCRARRVAHVCLGRKHTAVCGDCRPKQDQLVTMTRTHGVGINLE